ncbi:hypothetical protein BJ741DRAFT_639392 [Chytriomyces cf. hyalinus JEL632]|nr:hypothetical protein BJ741DRAFT_639392 [Chytriomyces cf. hyalinus JEL632]
MTTNCSSCQRHDLAIKELQLTIQSLQQQIHDEFSSLRRLLQIQPLPITDSAFLSLPVSPTACPSMEPVPYTPAVPSRPTFESMPHEILDQIASFVSGRDILQLSHAVRHYKYISKAMFDFARLLILNSPPSPVDFWPCFNVRPILDQISEEHLSILQTYSAVLSKHGGYARIVDPDGMVDLLCHLPKSLEVLLGNVQRLNNTDNLFSAIFQAKKNITKLTLDVEYISRCDSDPAWLNMTTKWLAKLRIYELEFPRYMIIPTQIRGMLHLVPNLSLLHLRNLEALSGVALSECKSLRNLSILSLVDATERPEVLVQQLLDILKGTRIQQLQVHVPKGFRKVLPCDLKDFVAAIFLENGWREQQKQYDDRQLRLCRK